MTIPSALVASLASPTVPAGRARVLSAWDETVTLRGLRLLLPDALQPILTASPGTPGRAIQVSTGAGGAYFAIGGLPGGPGAGQVDLLIKRGSRVSDAVI